MADTVRIFAATHVGYVRRSNEDRIRAPDWQTRGDDGDWIATAGRDGMWMLVADGMGGHGAGEVASEIAVHTLARRLAEATGPAGIIDAIAEANDAVHLAMTTGVGRPAMGTTIVGALLRGQVCTFFNVGDSRAYVLRGSDLTRHSVDHTPAGGRAVAMRSHALTQSLGGTLSRRRLEPHVEEFELAPGDIVMLCSDGLTDLVVEAGIASILRNATEHPAAALVAAALEAGGRDNVSVAVLAI